MSSFAAPEDRSLSGAYAELERQRFPLEAGMIALSGEFADGRARRIVDRIAQALGRGAAVEAAIGPEERQLPKALEAILAAGARRGFLGEAIQHYLALLERSRDLRERLRAALAYPLFLLGFIGAILAFQVFVILPMMTTLLDGIRQTQIEFGTAVANAPTLLVRILQAAFGLVALCLLLTAVAGAALLQSARGRGVLRRIPHVGSLFWWQAVAEWLRLIALCVRNELPLPQAVRAAAPADVHPDLPAAAEAAAAAVDSGQSLAEAMRSAPLGSVDVAPILAWSESHAAASQGLEIAADLFEARARSAAVVLTTALPALLVALIVSLTLFAAVLATWPMIVLLNLLGALTSS